MLHEYTDDGEGENVRKDASTATKMEGKAPSVFTYGILGVPVWQLSACSANLRRIEAYLHSAGGG